MKGDIVIDNTALDFNTYCYVAWHLSSGETLANTSPYSCGLGFLGSLVDTETREITEIIDKKRSHTHTRTVGEPLDRKDRNLPRTLDIGETSIAHSLVIKQFSLPFCLMLDP